MRYELGTTVYTADMKDIGKIDRLIVDPATGEMQSFVVRKGLLMQKDVVIPADLVRPLSFDPVERTIVLTIPSNATDTLLAFEENTYYEPIADAERDAGVLWTVPDAGIAVVTDGKPHRELPDEALDRVITAHPTSAILNAGSTIKSMEGAQLGYVQEVVTDPLTGQVIELIGKKGHLDDTPLHIPVAFVSQATDDTVYLTVDEAQAQAFYGV